MSRSLVNGPVFLCTLSLLLLLAPVSCRRDDGGVSGRDYPRVDGSTSTHPLGVLVACKLQGVGYEWRQPPALERTVFPSHQRHPVLAKRIEETVRHHGTHQAYVALLEKKADLILVAREPSAREVDAGRRAGVSFDTVPIARDALVFVTNAKNPIRNLTLDETARIFAGGGTWLEHGGPDAAIEPFQREEDSGSQELMEKLVMKGRAIGDLPRIYTMAGVVNTVGLREHGIAYSIYYYITRMAPNPLVKMIAIDGVVPDAGTIANGKYPLTSEVYAVVRAGTPPGDPAAQLRKWLLTAEGQAAVEESGYVRVRGR